MEDDELSSEHPSTSSVTSSGRLTLVVAPSDVFLGDESVTPTPGMESEMTGNDSEVSTPRLFESHFFDNMTLVNEGKVCVCG